MKYVIVGGNTGGAGAAAALPFLIPTAASPIA